MSRIYLDTRSVLGPSGLHRYCEGLIPALAAAAPSHEFIVVRLRRAGPTPLCTAPNVREVFVDGVTGTVANLASRKALERVFDANGAPDLLHSVFHVVPFGLRSLRRAPRRVVVTLHDLIWIDYAREVEPNMLLAAWRKRLGTTAIRHAVSTADHVLCDSEATRDAAARWLPREKGSVVHLGVDPIFAAEAARPAGQATTPYVAAFGIAKRYKNIGTLVQAFAILARTRSDLRLVLIGDDAGQMDVIVKRGLSDRVTIARSPSDEEMRATMRAAAVFVVPSMVEGFGLPALEAMASGVPLVISETPALREVAGDAAVTFPARDPGALATVIDTLLDDPARRAELSAEGRRRANVFTWARSARQTLDVFDRLLQTGD